MSTVRKLHPEVNAVVTPKTKERLEHAYEGWLFVFPPSAIKVGSVLRFEGSYVGYTRTYTVVKVLSRNFNQKLEKMPTGAMDRLRIRLNDGSISKLQMRDITVIGVCYSARWSLQA